MSTGQVCTSAERFYVADEIYDDYVSAFVAHAESLRLGDPMEDETDMGPMVSAAQRGKVVAQVEAAVGAGAELVTGGGDGGNGRGHFYAPAVVTGAAAILSQLKDLYPERLFILHYLYRVNADNITGIVGEYGVAAISFPKCRGPPRRIFVEEEGASPGRIPSPDVGVVRSHPWFPCYFPWDDLGKDADDEPTKRPFHL